MNKEDATWENYAVAWVRKNMDSDNHTFCENLFL